MRFLQKNFPRTAEPSGITDIGLASRLSCQTLSKALEMSRKTARNFSDLGSSRKVRHTTFYCVDICLIVVPYFPLRRGRGWNLEVDFTINNLVMTF